MPSAEREKGVTRLDDASPKNARRVGPKCSRLSLHERTGRTKSERCVRLWESRPKGWEATAFCHRDSPQRPIHQHETAAVHRTCTTSCAVHTRTLAQTHVVFQSFIH